ncbi:hypothetical protein LTR37_007885 [Vermiconidia calcicola]|uniref:Uncharacterized protein n=1 Tax=Vermiconidia calcicola TaxID=1690605 RepID=A0ACC3NCF0_9PEZI|nr:hypothetical protein LTR37_007885 [Vermiconidia calcicola]
MRRWLSVRPQNVIRSSFARTQPSTSRALHLAPASEDGSKAEQRHGLAPISDEHKSQSRHLLRAILRECTYLPDSSARQWISQHVIQRFRTYSFKVWKHRKGEGSGLDERLQRKLKEAKHALAQLRRANEGERNCLLKALLTTYGRVGKRRHELMRPLLPLKGQGDVNTLLGDRDEAVGSAEEVGETLDETVESEDAISEPDLTEAVHEADNALPTPKQFRTLELTPQLRALVVAQIKRPPPNLTRSNPRRLNPDIPALNSWLRPMPQKRVKNMKKKHYAQLLDRVQPPLPKEEWLQLRDLAYGKTPWSGGTVARRKAPSSRTDSPLEMVVQYGKVPDRAFGNREGHSSTPRFMRRLYAQVFAQCPLMEFEAGINEWKVIWGGRDIPGAALESTSSSQGTTSAATPRSKRESAAAIPEKPTTPKEMVAASG